MQELNLDVAGELPGDGGDADSHQVEDAAAAARDGGRRRRRGRGSARRAGAAAAGASEVQGGGRPAARARAAARPRSGASRRGGRRRLPATTTSRSWKSICSACSPRSRRSSSGAKQRPKVLLPPEQIPVEVRIDQLLGAAVGDRGAAGSRICSPTSHDRSGLIVTFLALLEMIRLKLVRVFQAGSFGPIRVYKRSRPADAPHPIGDPRDTP